MAAVHAYDGFRAKYGGDGEAGSAWPATPVAVVEHSGTSLVGLVDKAVLGN